MKKNSIKKSPSAIIIAAVALVTVVAVTLAMFVSNTEVKRLFSVSNFIAEGEVYFDNSGSRTVPSKNSDGTITVNYRDSAATNYIGKLRVNAKYSGYGVGLVRVKIIEEWSQTDGTGKIVLPYTLNLPYVVANPYNTASVGNQKAWFNNRANDYCYYYATPIYVASEDADSVVTVPLVTDFSADDIDLGAIASNTVLRIAVEVNAVQVNRYPQFWGLNRLPWTNASSSTNEPVSD